MALRSQAIPQPPRAPLRPRSMRRWALAAVVAAIWVIFAAKAGPIAGTVLFLMLAVVAVLIMVALRSLGISRQHPWVRRLAERPWRDGRDVLQLALRHLREVFIVTPSGSLLAPAAVELRLNPGDLASLTDMMDLELISSSAAEVYETQIAAHGAARAGTGPAEVSVLADPAVPAGRFELRQGRPLGPDRPPAGTSGRAPRPSDSSSVPAGPDGPPNAVPARSPATSPGGQPSWGRAAHPAVGLGTGATTAAGAGSDLTVEAGALTAAEPVLVPLLRLVTRGRAAETRVSGARAGRASDVELPLPELPTVSRVHASFIFGDAQWRITCLGRNGVTLNGVPLAGEQVVHDGDVIAWGRQSDALVSRVEIGWPRPLHGRPEP